MSDPQLARQIFLYSDFELTQFSSDERMYWLYENVSRFNLLPKAKTKSFCENKNILLNFRRVIFHIFLLCLLKKRNYVNEG